MSPSELHVKGERPMYYHRDGRPAESMDEAMYQWGGNTKEDFDRLRGVERTEVGDVSVSTVFLVMDHAWEGPPMIFETMIFEGEHDQNCWRYSTEEEAKECHAAIVKALQDGTELPE